MDQRRFGLPSGLIWWSIPLADLLVARIFVEPIADGSLNPVVEIIILGSALMTNALAVAAILRCRRGPIPGLTGFLIGGVMGVLAFAAMAGIAGAIDPEWVAWRLIGLHRAALWMRTDPELALQAISPQFALLLSPQVVPALIGFAIDRRYVFRYGFRLMVERRSSRATAGLDRKVDEKAEVLR